MRRSRASSRGTENTDSQANKKIKHHRRQNLVDEIQNKEDGAKVKERITRSRQHRSHEKDDNKIESSSTPEAKKKEISSSRSRRNQNNNVSPNKKSSTPSSSSSNRRIRRSSRSRETDSLLSDIDITNDSSIAITPRSRLLALRAKHRNQKKNAKRIIGNAERREPRFILRPLKEMQQKQAEQNTEKVEQKKEKNEDFSIDDDSSFEASNSQSNSSSPQSKQSTSSSENKQFTISSIKTSSISTETKPSSTSPEVKATENNSSLLNTLEKKIIENKPKSPKRNLKISQDNSARKMIIDISTSTSTSVYSSSKPSETNISESDVVSNSNTNNDSTFHFTTSKSSSLKNSPPNTPHSPKKLDGILKESGSYKQSQNTSSKQLSVNFDSSSLKNQKPSRKSSKKSGSISNSQKKELLQPKEESIDFNTIIAAPNTISDINQDLDFHTIGLSFENNSPNNIDKSPKKSPKANQFDANEGAFNTVDLEFERVESTYSSNNKSPKQNKDQQDLITPTKVRGIEIKNDESPSFTYEYETIGIVEESEGGTQKVIKPTSKDDSGTHTYTYISEYVIDTSYSSSPSTESTDHDYEYEYEYVDEDEDSYTSTYSIDQKSSKKNSKQSPTKTNPKKNSKQEKEAKNSKQLRSFPKVKSKENYQTTIKSGTVASNQEKKPMSKFTFVKSSGDADITIAPFYQSYNKSPKRQKPPSTAPKQNEPSHQNVVSKPSVVPKERHAVINPQSKISISEKQSQNTNLSGSFSSFDVGPSKALQQMKLELAKFQKKPRKVVEPSYNLPKERAAMIDDSDAVAKEFNRILTAPPPSKFIKRWMDQDDADFTLESESTIVESENSFDSNENSSPKSSTKKENSTKSSSIHGTSTKSSFLSKSYKSPTSSEEKLINMSFSSEKDIEEESDSETSKGYKETSQSERTSNSETTEFTYEYEEEEEEEEEAQEKSSSSRIKSFSELFEAIPTTSSSHPPQKIGPSDSQTSSSMMFTEASSRNIEVEEKEYEYVEVEVEEEEEEVFEKQPIVDQPSKPKLPIEVASSFSNPSAQSSIIEEKIEQSEDGLQKSTNSEQSIHEQSSHLSNEESINHKESNNENEDMIHVQKESSTISNSEKENKESETSESSLLSNKDTETEYEYEEEEEEEEENSSDVIFKSNKAPGVKSSLFPPLRLNLKKQNSSDDSDTGSSFDSLEDTSNSSSNQISSLNVIIVEAALSAASAGCYVTLAIRGEENTDNVVETNVVQETTLQPKFNEKFNVPIDDKNTDELIFRIISNNKCIAFAYIPANIFPSEGYTDRWFDLTPSGKIRLNVKAESDDIENTSYTDEPSTSALNFTKENSDSSSDDVADLARLAQMYHSSFREGSQIRNQPESPPKEVHQLVLKQTFSDQEIENDNYQDLPSPIGKKENNQVINNNLRDLETDSYDRNSDSNPIQNVIQEIGSPENKKSSSFVGHYESNSSLSDIKPSTSHSNSNQNQNNDPSIEPQMANLRDALDSSTLNLSDYQKNDESSSFQFSDVNLADFVHSPRTGED